MSTTMNILKEEVNLDSEYKDILKNKMRCIMNQSYLMFQAYADITKQSYFDVTQNIQIDQGEKFYLTIHISTKENLVTCSVTSDHGITLKLSASFDEVSPETKVELTKEEAKNFTSVVDEYKAPEDGSTVKNKEAPPLTRKYGKGYKIPDEIKQEIVKHLKEGKSAQWIMSTYHLSRTTTYRIAKEYGEKERIAQTPDAEMVARLQKYSDDIITSFAKGESIIYCSNLYQISRTALLNFQKSHQGAIEVRRKELAKKETGLTKAPVESNPEKSLGIDKESYIIEELIKGELNAIEIASKYQTTTAMVDKIADLNGALIKKRKEYLKNKKNQKQSNTTISVSSSNNKVTPQMLEELKNYFGGR